MISGTSYSKKDGAPVQWRGLSELIMRGVESEGQATDSWVSVDFPLGLDILLRRSTHRMLDRYRHP